MKKIYLFTLGLLVAIGAEARVISLTSMPDKTTFTAQYGDTLRGETGNRDITIQIAKNAMVWLDNVRINGNETPIDNRDHAGISTLGDAHIRLIGDNYVRGFSYSNPGIFAAKGYTLAITEEGSLTAEGGGWAAGIGAAKKRHDKSTASCGNIFIYNAKITAIGGVGSAGIGGASEASCGSIIICSSEVTAKGGDIGGAGIGSGRHIASNGSAYYSQCGFILIDDSYVSARGGAEAAGIGCGLNGKCGEIHIANNNKSVVAYRGLNAPYSIGPGAEEDAGSQCGNIYFGYSYEDITSTGFLRVGTGLSYQGSGVSSHPYIYPRCDIPDQVSAINCTQKTATISWKPAEGSSPQSWLIRWTKYGQSDWQQVTVDGADRVYTIKDLTANTRYEAEVCAVCGPDNTSFWYAIEFRTTAAPECPAPTNLSASTTASQIYVTWDRGAQTQWKVKYALVEEDKNPSDYNWTTKTTTNNTFSLYNLPSETSYMFMVQSDCGDGNTSGVVSGVYSTLVSCPAPTNLRVTETTDETATLTWIPGSSDQNTWCVFYKEADAENWTQFGTTWSTYPVTITGLKPDTQYKAYIYGKCSATDKSKNSGEVMFATEPFACRAPENLQVESVTKNSITISFTPYSDDQDLVLQYRKQGESTWEESWFISTPHTSQYLSPGTTYEMRVYASCYIGSRVSSECTDIVSATTLPNSPEERLVVTKCEFIGFEAENFVKDMVWNTEANNKVAKSIIPSDLDAPYAVANYGTLYKKNASGTGYTKVTDNTTLEADATYMYLIQAFIGMITDAGDIYRFPRSDEGITVDVTVNDTPWTARTSDYVVASDYSCIQMRSPDFQVVNGEGIEMINADDSSLDGKKLLIDGHLYIIRNGKIYTILGQGVK